MTKTELCNIAISNLGETVLISDIETDTSATAKKCRLFLDMAINGATSDFPWSFARAVTDLAILSDEESDLYDYVYAYPSDCLEPRSILIPNVPVSLYYRYYAGICGYPGYSGRESAPPEFLKPTFEKGVSSDGKTRTIMSNFEDATLLYTKNVSNEIAIWSDSFFEAVAWRLSAYLAMPVAQSPTLAQTASKQYKVLIEAAGAQDMRGENAPDRPLPESVTARLI